MIEILDFYYTPGFNDTEVVTGIKKGMLRPQNSVRGGKGTHLCVSYTPPTLLVSFRDDDGSFHTKDYYCFVKNCINNENLKPNFIKKVFESQVDKEFLDLKDFENNIKVKLAEKYAIVSWSNLIL